MLLSKIVIVCGYLLESVFASLFGAVLQTVIGGLISSFNCGICDIIGGVKWIYIRRRIWLILKGLFSVYFNGHTNMSRQSVIHCGQR